MHVMTSKNGYKSYRDYEKLAAAAAAAVVVGTGDCSGPLNDAVRFAARQGLFVHPPKNKST